MHRLRELMRQAVWTVANVQLSSLRAVVQPDCTKQGAIEPGLMTRARGYNNPIKDHSSMVGPGRNASEFGIHKKKRRRKHKTLRKSRSGIETLHDTSANSGRRDVARLDVGLYWYQYEKMELEDPPTDTPELISLPVMSWKRFAKDLMTSEAEELRQLFTGSATESEDTLSAYSKKERFEEQSWDSLKSSPYYEILREHRDVLPDEIPTELPQENGIQHEIDLVPGTKYCVTRQ
ncbi:reverse transcriptase [Phytophthora megakarya]|uniref:Reverse transcriptase n=1 Tax=Phytophthora megakarya TaxID=4795 RepID=A0A225VB08_9STRA|nr:reverse transcriptase [Phytophthora megakarya]